MTDLQTQKKAELLAAEALTYLEVVEGYVLSSDEELHMAEELLKAVKGKLKFIDQEKKISTAQLAEEKKRIDTEKKRIESFFAPAAERYELMETRIKRMIGQFVLERENARALLANQARAANTIQEKVALVEKASAVQDTTHVKGVTTRIVTRFRVTDPDSVPRRLCVPSDDLIMRALDAGEKDIPGVETYQDVITSSRSA